MHSGNTSTCCGCIVRLDLQQHLLWAKQVFLLARTLLEACTTLPALRTQREHAMLMQHYVSELLLLYSVRPSRLWKHMLYMRIAHVVGGVLMRMCMCASCAVCCSRCPWHNSHQSGGAVYILAVVGHDSPPCMPYGYTLMQGHQVPDCAHRQQSITMTLVEGYTAATHNYTC